MSDDELRRQLFAAIARVAPEARPERIDPRCRFRDELDLDSVDFLNLVVGLHQALGIEIPESDYGKLATIEGAVAYLARRLATRA